MISCREEAECESHTTTRPQITAPDATATLAMPGAHVASRCDPRVWRAPLSKPQADRRTGLKVLLACAWRPSHCTRTLITSTLVRNRLRWLRCSQSPTQLACATAPTLYTVMHVCRRTVIATPLTRREARRHRPSESLRRCCGFWRLSARCLASCCAAAIGAADLQQAPDWKMARCHPGYRDGSPIPMSDQKLYVSSRKAAARNGGPPALKGRRRGGGWQWTAGRCKALPELMQLLVKSWPVLSMEAAAVACCILRCLMTTNLHKCPGFSASTASVVG